MKANFLALVTISVCLLSAIAEAVLGCTSTTRVSLSDAPIVLFIVGPYLALATIAWWQREKLAVSWTLLAVVLGLSAWGLYVFGEDSYRYHTDRDYRKLQRLAAFIVPIVQYAAVLLIGSATLLNHLLSVEKQPHSDTEHFDPPKPVGK